MKSNTFLFKNYLLKITCRSTTPNNAKHDRDFKNWTSLKYLNEYEVAIQEAFDELFATETLIKREIIKYYIDNLYASSSN